MRVLVTGSTGYVGGRLVPALIAAGHDVRVTISDPAKPLPDRWWRPQVETVRMDILDGRSVYAACEGVDAVYMLIHGMGGDDFADADRAAARNLAHAVRARGVDRVVYLSGIIPDVPEHELSEHLAWRLEVERILTASPATVITLRAAIVLGSGSTSFEIVRQVTERLPARTVPEWMNSSVQPIAVVDVVEALVGALTVEGPSRHIDVGGPDAMPYGELLARYADVAGLERPQVVVPLVPTDVVGYLVGKLTDVPDSVVRALVESLHHDMVLRDPTPMAALLPTGYRLMGFEEAVRRSLAPAQGGPEGSDPMAALPHDPHWAGGGTDRRPLLAQVVDTAAFTATRVAAAVRRDGMAPR